MTLKLQGVHGACTPRKHWYGRDGCKKCVFNLVVVGGGGAGGAPGGGGGGSIDDLGTTKWAVSLYEISHRPLAPDPGAHSQSAGFPTPQPAAIPFVHHLLHSVFPVLGNGPAPFPPAGWRAVSPSGSRLVRGDQGTAGSLGAPLP